MRAEPGVSLVSGALQSSLAKAQRNYSFHGSDSAYNSPEGKEARKNKGAAAGINKHLTAYCNSVGSNFASFSSDQFLELGNALSFEDGGFLTRSIPNDIQNEVVILKQQNNQNVLPSPNNNVSKKKTLISTIPTTTKTSPPFLVNGNVNGDVATPAKKVTNNANNGKSNAKDSTSSPQKLQVGVNLGSGSGVGENPKKFDNLIQKLIKLLKDKTIGKNKRKRLTKKLRNLEKQKSETVLNSSGTITNIKTKPHVVNNVTKSPIKNATIVNGLDHNSSVKSKAKMGPENYKNGVVLTNGTTPSNSNNLQLPEPKRILYPKEKIILGWRTKRSPGAGFLNFGNTCYLNSSLQALFHIPAFVNWIQNDDEHRRICKGTLPNQTTCIICVVYITLQEHSRTNSAIRPRVLDKLKAICKHFSYGRQEDAHEFLRYLFEGMERSYLTLVNGLRLDNRTKETNPLGQIFGGYIRTEVTCLQCNSVSTTFQPSAELQLDIRHSTTLEDALMLHFRREKLDNNDYKCEKCRKICQATKQFSLELPPLVLCLQLKRFTLYGNKIGKRIHCNKFLNMSRYLHKSRKASGFYADNELKYRLVALVTHLGQSPNCGHYTAIAEGSNGSYFQFDDQYVNEVSPQTALNNDAYLLIYEMDRSAQPALSNGGLNSSNPSTSSSKPCTATSASANVNGSPIPVRKFAVPFAKTNGTNAVGLKTNSMMSNTDAIKSSSNGPGSSIDRQIIRFGIPPNSLIKSTAPSPNKINILKTGVALTNSARLYTCSPAASTPSSASVASKVVVPTAKCVKLVPYDAIDNDEDSDQEAKEEIPLKQPKRQEEKQVIIGPSSPSRAKLSKAHSPSNGRIVTPSKSNNLESTFGVKRKLEEILGPVPSDADSSKTSKSPLKKRTINATSDWNVTLNNGYNSDPENISKKSKTNSAVRARSMERVNPNRNKTSCGIRLPTAAPLIPNNTKDNKHVDLVSSKTDRSTSSVAPLEVETKPTKNGDASKSIQNGHVHSPSVKKKRKRSSSNSSNSSSSGEERKKRKKDKESTHHKKKGKKEKKKSAKPSSSSSSSVSSDSDSSTERHHSHKRHKSKKKHSKHHRDEKASPSKAEVLVNGRSATSTKRDASSVDREETLRNARNPSRSPSKSTNGTGSIDNIDIFSPNKIDRHEKKIVDWNGKESLLATAIEKERKLHTEKLRDEYDDELDQGRVKKQRISRSPSRDPLAQDGNKFQTHQDRKKLVGEWSSLMNGYGDGFKNHSNASNSPKDIKKPWVDKKFNGNHHPSSHHTNNYGPRQQNRNPNSSYSSSEYRSNAYPSRPSYNGYNGNNRQRYQDQGRNWRGRNRR